MRSGTATFAACALVGFAHAITIAPAANAVGVEVQTPPSCRNLATEMTANVAGPQGFASSTKTSCSFNAKTSEVSCKHRYTDTKGGSVTSTSVTKYDSGAALVDEIAVIPPLDYSISTTDTQNTSRGTTTYTVKNTFDSKRRMTKTVIQNAAGQVETTYTAWDPSGRPSLANEAGPGFRNTRVMLYDDARRLRVTMLNENQSRTDETFDADGNQIGTVTGSTKTAAKTTTAVTITTRQRICR